jgi:hypothetical protein
MTDYFDAPPGDRKVGKICMLPSSLGVPYLHHQHHECVPGNLICHQKELRGEQIAKLSKLTFVNNTEESQPQVQVDMLSVGVIRYDLQAKRLILRENTVVYIKRYAPRLHRNTNNEHDEEFLLNKTLTTRTRTKETKYNSSLDYQAFFHWINEQRQPLPIIFQLQRQGNDIMTITNVTGKHSFHSSHRMVLSPIKEMLEVIEKHITTITVGRALPPLQTIEVTDGFMPSSSSDVSHIVVDLPERYFSLLNQQ